MDRDVIESKLDSPRRSVLRLRDEVPLDEAVICMWTRHANYLQEAAPAEWDLVDATGHSPMVPQEDGMRNFARSHVDNHRQ